MLRMAMSSAASALLRALLERTDDQRDRILLTQVHSVDWQSLTLTGERHVIALRVPGPCAARIVHRFTCGIEEAEFAIPGLIVADIAVAGSARSRDGSITLEIEALTVAE